MSQPNNPMVYRIPHRINEELVMMIIFTKTEILPSVIGFGVGMVTGHTVWFLIGGILYTYGMRQLGKRMRPGEMRHWLWRRSLFPFGQSKSLPDPMAREYYR